LRFSDKASGNTANGNGNDNVDGNDNSIEENDDEYDSDDDDGSDEDSNDNNDADDSNDDDDDDYSQGNYYDDRESDAGSAEDQDQDEAREREAALHARVLEPLGLDHDDDDDNTLLDSGSESVDEHPYHGFSAQKMKPSHHRDPMVSPTITTTTTATRIEGRRTSDNAQWFLL
jgi:hypothetical protein